MYVECVSLTNQNYYCATGLRAEVLIMCAVTARQAVGGVSFTQPLLHPLPAPKYTTWVIKRTRMGRLCRKIMKTAENQKLDINKQFTYDSCKCAVNANQEVVLSFTKKQVFPELFIQTLPAPIVLDNLRSTVNIWTDPRKCTRVRTHILQSWVWGSCNPLKLSE